MGRLWWSGNASVIPLQFKAGERLQLSRDRFLTSSARDQVLLKNAGLNTTTPNFDRRRPSLFLSTGSPCQAIPLVIPDRDAAIVDRLCQSSNVAVLALAGVRYEQIVVVAV